MSEAVNLNAYFERIGFVGSIAPTLATLETLHALHAATIPFENLDPLIGQPVALDQKSLERKLLFERRGGYCFEHNHLLLRVLRDLDYSVRTLGARVLWNQPEGAVRPINHMLLAVDIAGASYISDVGFGGLSLTAPLRLRDGVEQETPHERFRLRDVDGTWHLEAGIGDGWRVLYAFEAGDFPEEDFAPINRALSSEPASRFRTGLHAAIAPPGQRHALAGRRLTTYRPGAEPERRELADLAEVKTVLAQLFGIALPAEERLDPALAAVLTEPAP